MCSVSIGINGRGFPSRLEFGVGLEFNESSFGMLDGGREVERAGTFLTDVVAGGGE